MVRQVSTRSIPAEFAKGQWTRNRSRTSSLSAFMVASKLRSASSRRWLGLLSLEVMNRSRRGRSQAASARPTPASLPYIWAVSMCR